MEAVCLPVGSEFKVNVYDTFGDGMCGSCYGGVDGNLLVSNLCGDELYYVGDTTQYESIGSDIIVVDPCFPPIPQGCTDSWFTEYDPAAVIDDGSCQTEVILGCTDPQAINFNEDANTLETEDNCEFTLTLTDGAGDGWFGSWIGVQQGDEIWGPITMHPNDGFEKEIQIPLYSGECERHVLHAGQRRNNSLSVWIFTSMDQTVCSWKGNQPMVRRHQEIPIQVRAFQYAETSVCLVSRDAHLASPATTTQRQT